MISDNFKKRSLTSIFLIFLLLVNFFFQSIFLYSLLIIGVVSILEFINLIKRIFKNDLNKLILSSIFISFLFAYFSLFFILSNFIQLKIILFSLLFGCIGSDIGGYVFGKIFKGPKITKISPNKTISGSLGSILICCLTFSGSIFFFINSINILIIITGIVTSIFCQLGDLFFSHLKRKAKQKDTGNLLPGHGGFLDRIDGMLLGIPVGFIFLFLFLDK
tara:strand:+ start:31 stop:687 length:657 start_codon:yes stop_codon:yes gene_type:complete